MKNNNFPDLSPVLCLWYPAIERREMKKPPWHIKEPATVKVAGPFLIYLQYFSI